MSKPVRKYQAGAIHCALWQNTISHNGRSRTVLKATVERHYRDSEGQWKSTSSFGRNDIPLVVFCLQKAFEAILVADQNGDEDTEEAPPRS